MRGWRFEPKAAVAIIVILIQFPPPEPDHMQRSFRKFMTGIMDYAGLFPPAELPMEQAFRNYVRHRAEAEAWMLSRFVCPASRLVELAPFHDELSDQSKPVPFSVLGTSTGKASEFPTCVAEDLEAVAAFAERHAGLVNVEVMEFRLPQEVVSAQDSTAVREVLDSCADLIEAKGPVRLVPYYESRLGADWRASLSAVLQGIAAHNAASTRKRCQPAGFKLRCGGLEAAAFPSCEQVAVVVSACRDAGVALKCTAGLHHPLRRYDPGVQAMMHGFLNVFAAGVLVGAGHLDVDFLQALLEDESADSFFFNTEGFAWRGLRATNEQIAAARKRGILSFGSCSFDEPREDLRALGLL
jgi:hypothetical protein